MLGIMTIMMIVFPYVLAIAGIFTGGFMRVLSVGYLVMTIVWLVSMAIIGEIHVTKN